jgi:Zn-dependent peptidase ImmA (M78 family)
MSKRYTRDQLKQLVLQLRRKLGLDGVFRLDMEFVLEKMQEVFPDFAYKRVPDSELQDGEGLYDSAEFILRIPDRLFEALTRRSRRAHFTIAHEIAHWVLAHEGQRFRRTEKRAYEIATPRIRRDEREAEQFAAFFIAPDHLARNCKTVEELENKFGLSRRAADIRLRELEADARREIGEERPLPSKVIDFLEQAKAQGYIVKSLPDKSRLPPTNEARKASKIVSARRSVRYLNEFCTSCGGQKIYPVDNRYRCENCGWVSDRFQDGDIVEG